MGVLEMRRSFLFFFFVFLMFLSFSAGNELAAAEESEKILEVSLNEEEQAALDHSIDAVKNLVADMGRLGF